MSKFKILDSNILLTSAENLLDLGRDGSTIVIPEVVLDEVDSKKGLMSELGFQAREFNRKINRAVLEQKFSIKTANVLEYSLDGVAIWIVTPTAYPSFADTHPSVINDRKIIHTASLFPDGLFLTNDVGCKIKAISVDVPTSDLKTIEKVDFEFTKDLVINDGEEFSNLHNKRILDIDPSYEVQNYNYRFTNPETNQVKLGYISNGGICQIIDKDLEEELRRQDISPINSGQLFLSRALQDTSIDIVVAEAKSGTGKTACAISNGIRMVSKGYYEGIIYMRNSVDDTEKAEEIGFLSGNEDKYAVYLHPLYDTLEFIVRSKFKRKKGDKLETYEQMVEDKVAMMLVKYNIQPMLALGTRGRTFNNVYVIYDESQNASKGALQKFLTRVGKGSKVVLTGSSRQIDHPYVTKFNNGLSVLLDAAAREHEKVTMFAVTLTSVARGKITEFGESLFDGSKNNG